MAEVHPAMASTTVTNLGQVELDLEINTSGNGNKSAADKGKSKGAATGNGTRKKSSSALQAEGEEGGSGKKTSKSSDESEQVRVAKLSDAHAHAQCGLMSVNPGEAALPSAETSDSPPEALACKDNTAGEFQSLNGRVPIKLSTPDEISGCLQFVLKSNS